MKLDTITKIERFMTDALLSSPQIPLGVNVVRLAATTDEEGLTQLARSIAVRYVGSDVRVTQNTPMILERQLSFEITLASQSYLTQSGHDYVIQMCAGSYNTLINQVPTGTDSQIIEPLHLTSERFNGLTDSTHYVYVQTWQLLIRETKPLIALDPCVQWGNCSYLFPANTVSTVRPGDVISANSLYSPVLPPPAVGEDYEPDLCGVEVNGDDLVYTADPDLVFLENWTEYELVPTDRFDESGEMLIVNIYDKDGNFVRWYFASNCDDRKVIQIAGQQPASSNRIGGLWRSPADNAGNPSESGFEHLRAVHAMKNGFGFVNVIRATIFTDPTDPSAPTAIVKYGSLFNTQEGVELTHDNESYYFIGGTPLGKAWVKQKDLKLLQEEDYQPRLNCVTEEIEPGSSEGSGENTGGLPQ